MTDKTYQIDSLWDKDILIIVMTGKCSAENANEIARRVAEILDEYKPSRVLCDTTKLVGRLSVTETYYHVREYKPSKHRPEKFAVLDNQENKSYTTFHETTAANIGLRLTYFSDRNKAMEWLKE